MAFPQPPTDIPVPAFFRCSIKGLLFQEQQDRASSSGVSAETKLSSLESYLAQNLDADPAARYAGLLEEVLEGEARPVTVAVPTMLGTTNKNNVNRSNGTKNNSRRNHGKVKPSVKSNKSTATKNNNNNKSSSSSSNKNSMKSEKVKPSSPLSQRLLLDIQDQVQAYEKRPMDAHSAESCDVFGHGGYLDPALVVKL